MLGAILGGAAKALGFMKSAPAIVGAGASLAGGLLSNRFNAQQAEMNRAFQADMSNTSYQRVMQDLEAAGLNPMLAIMQGGASTPLGNMASAFSNPGLDASSAFAAQQTAQAATDTAQATVKRTIQDIQHSRTDEDRLRALTQNLGQEYQNLVKTGWNLTEVGNHLRAQITQIASQITLTDQQAILAMAQQELTRAQTGVAENQATLTGLDVEASTSLGNIGREASQLTPVLQFIVDVLRITSRRD